MWCRRVFPVLGFLLLSSIALAQPAEKGLERLTVERLLDYEAASEPQVSPDGTQVVYTRRWVNTMTDEWESALWIVDTDGGRHRFLTKGSSPRWSPDGSRLAYVAEGEPAGQQIFVRWMDAEAATTQVTRVDESPANIRWSPDGTQLGFTMFVPTETTWKIDLPQPPEGAEWTKAPIVADRLHYRQDRRGYTETGYTHLFLVPADSGTPRALTSGEWLLGAPFDNQVYEVGWDWSPDGTTIVVDGLDAEDADLRYRDSDIFAIDVASGERRQLTAERGTWASPRISPNGRLVAFAGHPFTTASYQASELYVMSIEGTDARKISGDFDRDAYNLQWAGDSSGVYFTAGNEGTSNVHFNRIDGGVEPVTTGEHMMALGNISANDVAVGVRTSPQAPPDVVRFSLGAPSRLTQLTNLNVDLLGRVTLGEVEEIWYDSSDGTRVQGWIVKPPDFDGSKRYPLIFEIHGGPHGMYNVGFNYMFQAFAAQDFVVLYTNPRGSTGYGSPFGNAIERAYPSVDYDDLMAGVDAVVARGYIDERNMFVGGCSGGGVLSSWVIGHTDRFAAAAVRCPVTNWLSFVGQTDIPLFTRNFFDAPFWEQPEQWLEQSSLMYVGNVTTPTLLMTGILDMRTPMAQTEEYYTALKMRGIPTKLLRFEEEYHGTSSKPSNHMRTLLYMMSWYREHGHWDEPSSTTASR